MRLFHLINQHPTLYEEVTGRGDGPGFEGRPAERARYMLHVRFSRHDALQCTRP